MEKLHIGRKYKTRMFSMESKLGSSFAQRLSTYDGPDAIVTGYTVHVMPIHVLQATCLKAWSHIIHH